MSNVRPPMKCGSCGCVIWDRTSHWHVPPLGAVCNRCWPAQAKNYLREYRTPKPKQRGS